MYTLFGHSRESFAGLTWLDAVHPDDRPTALNELKTVVAEGRNFDYEFRIVRPDGEVRWIASRGRAQRDAQGLTTRVFGINVDITERHSAELERAALAKRMQLAADAAHIGLWERDAEGDEGNWNSANFALWGLPRNVRAPSTEQVTERVHPDERAAFRAQVREAAAGREPDDLEYRVVHGDGRTVVLRSRVRPVTTGGRSLRIVGVNIDVTQQRLAEQALIAKEMAERANQAKTEFLSRMSHELRTPLNAVIGFSQLLRLDTEERPSLRQLARLQHIENAGAHLLALVNDVLDLSRVDSGQMTVTLEPVDLRSSVEDALSSTEKVVVDVFSELVVEFARKHEATTMVKGLRVISDFEWEFQMNHLNRQLAPDIETLYVMANPLYSFVSSSGVKEIASFGGRVDELVPPAVARRFAELYPDGKPGAPVSPSE